MDKRNLAFGRMNFILLAIGMVIVILGFILMSGAGSNETTFNPDIFSTMRVKVAPVVCFVGFISMVYGVLYRTKDDEGQDGTALQKTDNKKEVNK